MSEGEEESGGDGTEMLPFYFKHVDSLKATGWPVESESFKFSPKLRA